MFALPPAFEEKMKKILKEEYPAFREGYELPRKFGLRINRDKITPEEFEKLAFMPELTFAWGAAIYDPDTDNDLFSTCRRADKNMYMKKQKFYEDRMKREDEDGIVGQAVKERAKGQ